MFDSGRSVFRGTSYLIVVPVPCFQLSEDLFAVEDAFAEHLRQLQILMKDSFDRIRIVAPRMSRSTFENGHGKWGIVSSEHDRVSLRPAHPSQIGFLQYSFLHLLPNIFAINYEVRQAAVVHAGSSKFFHPYEIVSILLAILHGRPSVFVTDIDTRLSAKMNFIAGRWSRKSYMLERLIYSPFKSAQIWLAARFCSLVLLKGQKLCDDFGFGRENVKKFIDTSFSAEHVIPSADLDRKIERLYDKEAVLELVYFGRLVGYKGVDKSIDAIARSVAKLGPRVRFQIIGAGPEESALREQVQRLGISNHVVFQGHIPFGPELFTYLRNFDLLLATPMSEDTPRSALDAMAIGVPILAFDTYYYRDFLNTGAVDIVPWNSVELLSERIIHYASNKKLLGDMSRRGVEFAKDNTQEIWLQRRYQWILKALRSTNNKNHC